MKLFQLFIVLLFAVFISGANAQDTLILISGKIIVVKAVDLKDYTIAYRPIEKDAKLRTIDPEKVFSIKYRDGSERVIYRSDSLDPIDFSVNDMRLFIKGEQDAREFFRNRPIQVLGFASGVVSGMFGFYGILGPPLFATVFGSFSPKVEKRMSFRVNGEAALIAGIQPMKYLNSVTGTVSSPVFGEGQRLKINSHSVEVYSNVDSAAAEINSTFHRHLVHAAVDHQAIKLYRSDNGALLTEGAYREGFEKRGRDYKIRRGAISGLLGFLVGSVAFTIIYN